MVKFLDCEWMLGRNSCWPRDLEPDIEMRIKQKDYLRPNAKLDRGRERHMVIRSRGTCDTFNSDIKESPIARFLK